MAACFWACSSCSRLSLGLNGSFSTAGFRTSTRHLFSSTVTSGQAGVCAAAQTVNSNSISAEHRILIATLSEDPDLECAGLTALLDLFCEIRAEKPPQGPFDKSGVKPPHSKKRLTPEAAAAPAAKRFELVLSACRRGRIGLPSPSYSCTVPNLASTSRVLDDLQVIDVD